MRKIVPLLIIILLSYSCNHKPKEQVETQKDNIITAAEKRNQEIQDSLKHVNQDSLALVAWGDVKFGMTMRETLATENFKDGYKYPESSSISMNSDKAWQLGKVFGLNHLGSFWAHFQENELVKIHIESSYPETDQINKLVRDCDIFIKNFTEKYGKPTFKKEKVSITEFNPGEEIEYARFQIGDKSITLLLGEDSSIDYYYNIYIENNKFPKKKKIPTEKEKREKEKQRKEAKEIKENSF